MYGNDWSCHPWIDQGPHTHTHIHTHTHTTHHTRTHTHYCEHESTITGAPKLGVYGTEMSNIHM